MNLNTEMASCTLRPWRESDKPSLLRHANNRNAWRNLTDMFPNPYTAADADASLEIASQPGPSLHLAIAVDDEAVGGIGLLAGSGIYRYTAHFGYWLGEALWGRGIASAAACAMVKHALSGTDFVRLEAPVFAWNPASVRVLEKAGFVQECVRKHSVFKDGQLIDSFFYAAVRAA